MRRNFDEAVTELTFSVTSLAKAFEELARQLDVHSRELRRVLDDHHRAMLDGMGKLDKAIAENREHLKLIPVTVADRVSGDVEEVREKVENIGHRFYGLHTNPNLRAPKDDKDRDRDSDRDGDGDGDDDSDEKDSKRRKGKGKAGIATKGDEVHFWLTKRQIGKVWGVLKWVIVTLLTGGGIAAAVKGLLSIKQ